MSRGPSRPISWFWLAILAIALFLVAGFAAIKWSIHTGVRDVTEMALRDYPGDEVVALSALVESDDHPLASRNRAVWALGQLRDRRALQALEHHYTGQPCDHARMLCQHELKKAIDLIRSRPRP